MRISDWSSDVCSSDLFIGEPRRFRLIGTAPAQSAPPGLYRIEVAIVETGGAASARSLMLRWQPLAGEVLTAPMEDRKRVGSGKSVSVRVDLGGRRFIKKNNKITLLFNTRITSK